MFDLHIRRKVHKKRAADFAEDLHAETTNIHATLNSVKTRALIYDHAETATVSGAAMEVEQTRREVNEKYKLIFDDLENNLYHMQATEESSEESLPDLVASSSSEVFCRGRADSPQCSHAALGVLSYGRSRSARHSARLANDL